MKALREVDEDREGTTYKQLMLKTSIKSTESNHKSLGDFGASIGDQLVVGAAPFTEKKQNGVAKAKGETAPFVVGTLSCGRSVCFRFDVQTKDNQSLPDDQAYSRVAYGEWAFFAAHAAKLSRADLNKLGVARSVKGPVSLSIILPLDASSWKNVPGGIASLLGKVTVPIGDVRSFIETGKFPGKATDPLHAMFREGMVVSDEDRRAKVQVYADAFVLTRRASKNVFPISPENFSKDVFPQGPPVIVSLEEALERANPRSRARGSRKRTAASKKKLAAKKKKPAAAPPAKKPAAAARPRGFPARGALEF